MDMRQTIKKITTGQILTALSRIRNKCIVAAKTDEAKKLLVLSAVALAQEDTVRVKTDWTKKKRK